MGDQILGVLLILKCDNDLIRLNLTFLIKQESVLDPLQVSVQFVEPVLIREY